MKDRTSKVVLAYVVEMKGRGLEGTIERVISNLATIGHEKVILRTDQEPAFLDLVKGVIETRAEPTLPENSPVGEP